MSLDINKIRGGYATYVDGGCICQYCGFDGTRSSADWVQLQIDHLIPRRISGEYRDEPLNRVVTCYHCNTQKRNFDPSYGTLVRVPDEKTRQELIQVVIDYLKKGKEKAWSYGGGFEESYQYMMNSIKNSQKNEN